MRPAKLLFASMFMLILCISGYSQTTQDESFRFPGENIYQKGKIYFNNNTRFEVTDLKIVNDRLSFIQKKTSQVSEYDLADIQIIKVTKGSYAGEYALYGGAVFALSAVLAIAKAESDPYYNGDLNEGAFIGGFAAAGIFLGGIIGSTRPKWKTLYVNDHASSLNRQIGYALNLRTNGNFLGLSLQLSY